MLSQDRRPPQHGTQFTRQIGRLGRRWQPCVPSFRCYVRCCGWLRIELTSGNILFANRRRRENQTGEKSPLREQSRHRNEIHLHAFGEHRSIHHLSMIQRPNNCCTYVVGVDVPIPVSVGLVEKLLFHTSPEVSHRVACPPPRSFTSITCTCESKMKGSSASKNCKVQKISITSKTGHRQLQAVGGGCTHKLYLAVAHFLQRRGTGIIEPVARHRRQLCHAG
eukprot:1758584-Rhodomonas_salina.2